MALKRFALIYGIVFLIVGMAGFIPGLTTAHDHPNVTMDSGMGAGGARLCQGSLLRLCAADGHGADPGLHLNTTFGLMPLYGHDIRLHALLAAGAGYFAFRRPVEANEHRGVTAH